MSWRHMVMERSHQKKFKKKSPEIDNALFWTSVLWIMGEMAGDGLWLWLLAVGTSMAFQQHFNGTSTALQRNFNGKQNKYI